MAALDSSQRTPRFVHDLLAYAVATSPDSVAVTDAHDRWTYRRLAHEAARSAAWLADQGVRPGQRVICALPAGARGVALVYACSMVGAVFVPLAPTMTVFGLRPLRAEIEPAVTFVADTRVSELRDLGFEPVVGLSELVAELPAAPPSRAPVGRTPGETAFLLYTSGSSAVPRGVICPHRQVLHAVTAIARRLRYRADDVVYCRLPLSFDYGLYQVLLSAHARCELVLDADLPAIGLLARMRSRGATVVPVVPAMASVLTWFAGRQPVPDSVRLFTSTGAALSPSCAAELRRQFPGARSQIMYGLTECKRATISAPDGDRVRPGSVGLPIDGLEITVVADGKRSQRPGVVGEILICGGTVMAGYWRDPALTARRFRPHPETGQPELHTGDLGYLDADGHLYVLGRIDDIFNQRGVRTSCQEIEAAVHDIPGVRAAAVLPPRDEQDATLFVVTDMTPGQALEQLRVRLEPGKCPAHCRVVTALPLTSNGKVDRAGLERHVNRMSDQRSRHQDRRLTVFGEKV